MWHLVLFSTLLGALVAREDRLQFSFHFTCQPSNPNITKWRHFIELVDTWNDVWFTPATSTKSDVGKDNTLVRMEVVSKGDQWGSSGYEPYLRMRHSCMDSGETEPLEVWPTDVIPIGFKETSVEVHFDVTNKKGFRDPNGDLYHYDSKNWNHTRHDS